MKKIALAGLIYEKSTGDRLLIECAKYLCKKQYGEEIEFIDIDFYGRTDYLKKTVKLSNINATDKNNTKSNILQSVWKFAIKIGGNPVKNIIYRKQYKKFFNSVGTTVFMKKYFDERLKDVDLIMFLGGGTIKYDVRIDFGKYYRRITNAAKERNIPITVVTAGIESKYNPKDARCLFFSDTLSDNAYKIISTRDDIDELNKYVTNPEVETTKIADIGVWSSDVYNIEKDSKSDTIGIGVIVADRFLEFNRGISHEQYDNALVEVIKKLEARGEKVQIFNNGDPEDQAYAEHISELVGKKKTDVKTAQTPEDLVKIISGFKGVITSRLHSCVPAYSLDIPFVAISWNKKLKFFAENINVPERVIESDRLNSDIIIKVFDKALKEGYDSDYREKYKQTDLEFIDKCLAYLK